MRNLRATLRGRMTRTSLAIAVASTAIIYVWVVTVQGESDAKGGIVIGGLFAVLAAFVVGYYSSRVVGRRITRLEAAARREPS